MIIYRRRTEFSLISLKKKRMTLIIKGAGLTIEDVVAVARHQKKVALHPDAIKSIEKCRARL